MNILIYSHFYPAPPELKTRVDTLVVHYFAKELVREGHRVQVIFLASIQVQKILKNRFHDIVPFETDYTYEGVPVHLIRYQSLTPHRSFAENAQMPIINRKLKAFKQRLGWTADKVFVHFPTEFTGITEIFSEGVPVLGDFHNIDIAILNKRFGGQAADYIKRIGIWGYRNKRVQAGLRAVGEHAMTRTYSGIDGSLFASKEEIEQKLTRKGDHMRILYAGQLIPLKNIDVLIEAVQKLSFSWEMTIVGDGSERARLECLAASSSRIHFTGKLSRAEVSARMMEADVFIMLSSPETYGLVYLEAMAQGCLVIASLGEGFDGIITDGKDGFLEKPGSVEATVCALRRAHDLERDEWTRIVRAGYALASDMTEEKIALRFLQDNV